MYALNHPSVAAEVAGIDRSMVTNNLTQFRDLPSIHQLPPRYIHFPEIPYDLGINKVLFPPRKG